jgi:hypothetical protein
MTDVGRLADLLERRQGELVHVGSTGSARWRCR